MTPIPLTDGRWSVKVPADWLGFTGHFPGNPILPAAMLIDLALRIAGSAPGIRKARFPAPVRPGDSLILSLSDRTVTISSGNGVVAEIRLN